MFANRDPKARDVLKREVEDSLLKKPEIQKFLRPKTLLLFVSINFCASGLMSYGMTLFWPTVYAGWGGFWRGAFLAILAFFLSLSLSIAAAPAEIGLLILGLSSFGVLAGVPVGILWGAGTTASLGAGAAIVGIVAVIGAGLSFGWIIIIAQFDPIFALGLWLRTIAIRFAATSRFLSIGFWNIPANFVQTLFIVDLCHPPELVPGYNDPTINEDILTFEGLVASWRKSSLSLWKVQASILFAFFFVPAYIYRLSIKSTCWLYLPLVYIASKRDFVSGPLHLLARLGTPKEWLRRGLALITIFGFAFTTFIHNPKPELAALLGPKFVSPIEYFILIDFFALKPWQACSLLSATITAYLYFAAGDIRVNHAYAADPKARDKVAHSVGRLRILMRLRNVFSIALIVVVGIHVLLAFSPIIPWIPRYILQGLIRFYGPFMPPMQ
jgi:hypothetical protein